MDKKAEVSREVAIADEKARLEREAERVANREAEDARLAHEERMEQMRLNADVKKAQAQARVAKVSPKVSESSPKVSATVDETYGHWRTLPDEIKRSLVGLSAKDIHARFPHLHERTAENWAGYAVKLPQNGHTNGKV